MEIVGDGSGRAVKVNSEKMPGGNLTKSRKI